MVSGPISGRGGGETVRTSEWSGSGLSRRWMGLQSLIVPLGVPQQCGSIPTPTLCRLSPRPCARVAVSGGKSELANSSCLAQFSTPRKSWRAGSEIPCGPKRRFIGSLLMSCACIGPLNLAGAPVSDPARCDNSGRWESRRIGDRRSGSWGEFPNQDSRFEPLNSTLVGQTCRFALPGSWGGRIRCYRTPELTSVRRSQCQGHSSLASILDSSDRK